MGLPYSPEEFEELKKAMRLRWQRGYDDAVAGRPMNLDESGRPSPDYFGGYDAGEAERLSGKSESGKSESGKSDSGKSEIRGIETANRCAVPQNSKRPMHPRRSAIVKFGVVPFLAFSLVAGT
jgi:hypothetical protein